MKNILIAIAVRSLDEPNKIQRIDVGRINTLRKYNANSPYIGLDNSNYFDTIDQFKKVDAQTEAALKEIDNRIEVLRTLLNEEVAMRKITLLHSFNTFQPLKTTDLPKRIPFKHHR